MVSLISLSLLISKAACSFGFDYHPDNLLLC
jgi:hypothetical protein